MRKCDCYRLRPTIRYTYDPLTGSPIAHDIKVGFCAGTKECEECRCGGYMTKCDFYPYVREKGRESVKIEDAISYYKHGISHDIFSEPVISYAKLAIEALEKQLHNKE